MAKQIIVTRKTIEAGLSGPNAAEWCGRALVALLARQTVAEQQMEATVCDNGVGFTGADAKIATSITNERAAAAGRTSKPKTSAKPPKNSAAPANRAIRYPGFRPTDPKNWPVPSRP